MAIERQRIMTLDEFEAFIAQPDNAERLFELIHGEIVEKMPTEEHGELALLIGSKVRDFAVKHRLGRVGVEVRHRLPNDTENSRLPDVSFIAGKRKSVKQGSVPQMPDLAIEIKSPDDSLKELRARAEYYLANGTKLVWIFDPRKRIVIRLSPDDEQILVEGDVLDGEDILPGFALPLSEVFDDPLDDDE